jgi:H+/gluconate symporter-like permease
MTEEKLPPEMKRAVARLILMLLGYICASAVFFYVVYLLYMSLNRRHR